MKFVIQVNSSPYQSQSADTAYRFALAALEKGHEVMRIFFYHDGVYNALHDSEPPADEWQFRQAWSDIAQQHAIDLVVCVSAGQRRGLSTQREAVTTDNKTFDLAPGFRISGLGQWVEAALVADRLITFG